MPVPIAVTNPGGVGLVGHTLASLETAGPFARLAQKTSASDQASTIQSPAASTGDFVAAPITTPPSEFSVLVNGLEFSYPGLGRLIINSQSLACRNWWP